MQIYKLFLQMVRIFWLISKLFLGLIFFYCAYFVLDAPETFDYIVAGIFVLFGSAMLWIFYAELFKNGASRWIKLLTGITTMLMAIGMIFITLNTFDFLDSYTIVAVISIYFLTGYLDFVNFNKKSPQVALEKVAGHSIES